jgi:cytochrome P450
MARVVSAAAADPENATLKCEAELANAELITHFPSGLPALRDSTFVALSQTVPCILGNAWFALIDHPKQWRRLNLQPAVLDQAIEELLRYAGLVRTLFRTATEDVNLNGAEIRSGDVLILRIIEANRDPERFAYAHQLDVVRQDGGHLALGAGSHACVGASLIRMTAQSVTRPLLRRFASASLARPVEWQGGSTFQSPQSLWVCLSEDPA